MISSALIYTLFSQTAQTILGLMYANAGEWVVHKYLLHRLGKNPQSFWAYHWHEHHAVCIKNAMLDPGYRPLVLTKWNAQTKELAVLACIVLVHAPLFIISPAFGYALYASVMLYYYRHRQAHLDRDWAKRHLRWHYEHHLGANNNANWCVTWPWFDYLMGSRVKLKAMPLDEP